MSTILKQEFKLVGQPLVRKDVVQKVSGEVSFSGDVSLPGMLHAKLVRSLYPSAEIEQIDVTGALGLQGVTCVLTADDIPHNSLDEDPSGTGLADFHQPVLAKHQVKYVGEPIAIVVAEDPEIAHRAMQLVDVQYKSIPGVFHPLDALAADAVLVHPTGNECVVWHANKGDVDAVKQACPVQIKREYRTQFVDHAYTEPESGVAWVDNDGCIVVRAATQVIEHYRHIAEILAIPQSAVRVISPYVGGGFGGKEDMTVEPYIALAAWKTRRPVKMIWSRNESLQARPKRHPMILRYEVGAEQDGTIRYMDVEVIGDAGAYAMLSPRVLFASSVVATGPYKVPNARVTSRAVYTNNTPSSAFRGFGAMQVAVGYEQIIDELAEVLHMNRIELRKKNFLERGDTLATGEEIETAVWLDQCLNSVVEALGSRPVPSRPGRIVGRGISSNIQPYGRTVWFRDHASAWLSIEEDESLVVRIGVPDLGGGQAAALCQIAAEVLELPLEKVRPYFGDSALTPLAGGTFATRQLFMSGNAVLKASRELKEKVLQIASSALGVAASQLVYDGGCARSLDGRTLTLADLVKENGSQRIEIQSTFFSTTGPGYDNVAGKALSRTFPDYTFGCHGCDVEIDTDTGQVTVLRYVACHDIGRAINPLSVEGQIQGGTVQGLGYALSEEVLFDEGQCLNGSFAQYLAPLAPDVPNVEAIILESGEGKGPLQARGIGEPAIAPVAPAVANAVADALGRAGRVRSLPITPEKVFGVLHDN